MMSPEDPNRLRPTPGQQPPASYPPPSQYSPQQPQSYPPPGYPPPQGYGPPPRPPKRSIFTRWWFWSAAVVVVIIIIVAASSGGSTDTQAGGGGGSDTAGGPTSQSATSQAPTTSKAKPTPAKVVLNQDGNGIADTKSFTVTKSEWTIKYRFDCSNFGGTGNFQIYLYKNGSDLPDVAANALKASGSAVAYEHGAGRYHMKVNSECDWHVRVKG